MESEATGKGAAEKATARSGLPAPPEFEGEASAIRSSTRSSAQTRKTWPASSPIDLQAEQARLAQRLRQGDRSRAERTETRSYIIGESTERRLAIYRRLAASTLSGEPPSRSAGRAKTPISRAAAGPLWALAIIVALAVVYLAITPDISLARNSQRTSVRRRAARVSPV